MRIWIQRYPKLLKFLIGTGVVVLLLERYDQDLAYFILYLVAP